VGHQLTILQKKLSPKNGFRFVLSVCLSICLSVYLSICLSVYLSICLSVYLSICLSITFNSSLYSSIRPSICLIVTLSVCSFCLSISHSISMYHLLSVLLLAAQALPPRFHKQNNSKIN
jgi:hypothetical protein